MQFKVIQNLIIVIFQEQRSEVVIEIEEEPRDNARGVGCGSDKGI